MSRRDAPPLSAAAAARRAVLGSMAAGLAWPLGAHALQAASPPVVLTITGRVRHTNGAAGADFDMGMLEKLPQTTMRLTTPWYAQPRSFTGPLLRDVLQAAGASGETLRTRALNDYRVDIPFDDAKRFDVVLARLLDGAPMTVRDKGPLFIVYPFDAHPELRTALYYSRSAWQLRSIEVR